MRILLSALLLALLAGGAVAAAELRPLTGEPTAGATEAVHLGDSYAAGTGVTPLAADSPFPCQRSARNFGALLARREHWRLTDVSCAGATTAELGRPQYEGVPAQLEALGPQTAVVTLTIGGNDAGLFSRLVGGCTRAGRSDPRGHPCRDELSGELTAALDGQVAPDLRRALARIRAAAPNAQILVAGYPRILPATGGCFDQVSIAAGDRPFVRRMEERLNQAVQTAAMAAGATFVDMTGPSAGHDVCAGAAQRWVEPMIDGPGALHPNARGQQAIADAVAAARGAAGPR